MWTYTKSGLALAAIGIMAACVLRAESTDESTTSHLAPWEYKVLDLAVMTNYPVALINPKTEPTAVQLEEAERLMKIHSELNAEFPRSVPSDSVHRFERQLNELGSAGWDLVLKDRNMVVFKRPKR